MIPNFSRYNKFAARQLSAHYKALHPTAPLNGKAFLTKQFHEYPHHYLHVVPTYFEALDLRLYQVSNPSTRISRIEKDPLTGRFPGLPQARFSYTPSPVEVRIRERPKPLYEFVTSLLGILGGAFSVCGAVQAVLRGMGEAVKRSSGKIL